MGEDLKSIVKQIIEFSRDGKFTQPPSDAWLRLDTLFYRAIENSGDIEITEAIALDENLELPFYIACDLYQKRLYLKTDSPVYLIGFANFLRLNSNSWNYLADYFDKVARDTM